MLRKWPLGCADGYIGMQEFMIGKSRPVSRCGTPVMMGVPAFVWRNQERSEAEWPILEPVFEPRPQNVKQKCYPLESDILCLIQGSDYVKETCKMNA